MEGMEPEASTAAAPVDAEERDEVVGCEARALVRAGEHLRHERAFLFVEGQHLLFDGAGGDHLAAQAVIFFLGAIAPVNASRLGQRGDFCDPVDQFLVFDVGGGVHCGNACHEGLVHMLPPMPQVDEFGWHGRIVVARIRRNEHASQQYGGLVGGSRLQEPGYPPRLLAGGGFCSLFDSRECKKVAAIVPR
jgi:hypothetical protein